MRLSSAGLAFLTREEGVRRQVYNDANGKTISSYSDPGLRTNGGKGYPTIGLGLALLTPDLRLRYAPYLGGGRKMTDDELAASVAEAIVPRERSVTERIKRPVSQAQFDMLFSFYYNRGASKGFKAAIAAVNAGDFAAAARAIAASSSVESVAHIAQRRIREAAVFQTGAEGASALLYLGVAAVLFFVVRRATARP